MIELVEKSVVEASPDKVFWFLTNIDKLYKHWHPKDHVFCKTLRGNISEQGAIYHFLEFLRFIPLYLVVQNILVEKNSRIECGLVFPFSLLRLGTGGFVIEEMADSNKSLLTAFVTIGNDSSLGKLLDKVIYFLVPREVALNHMRDESKNISRYFSKNK